MGLQTSPSFDRCLVSNPNQYPWFLCQHNRRSLLICTFNPEFEIMRLGEAYNPVKKTLQLLKTRGFWSKWG